MQKGKDSKYQSTTYITKLLLRPIKLVVYEYKTKKPGLSARPHIYYGTPHPPFASQIVPLPQQGRLEMLIKNRTRYETKLKVMCEPELKAVQALGLLVSVNYIHYCTSISDLSNS